MAWAPVQRGVDARFALVLAIVSGGAAVGAVALDLSYTLVTRLDSLAASGWTTVAASPFDEGASRGKYPFPGECASKHLRLVVDNHRPIQASPHVRIAYSNYTHDAPAFFDETWSLSAFGEQTHQFQIPDEAFDAPGTPSQGYKRQANVVATVGDLYLSTCVQEDA